jgi:hypothetical protein
MSIYKSSFTGAPQCLRGFLRNWIGVFTGDETGLVLVAVVLVVVSGCLGCCGTGAGLVLVVGVGCWLGWGLVDGIWIGS